jgi:hypothetical protein
MEEKVGEEEEEEEEVEVSARLTQVGGKRLARLLAIGLACFHRS